MNMRTKQITIPVLLLGVTLCMGPGCSRNAAPEPLAEDQVVPALEAVFKDASVELKAISSEVVSNLQAKASQQAFTGLNALSGRPDLTTKQRQTVARSLISVNEQLQQAAATGNTEAASTLGNYRARK